LILELIISRRSFHLPFVHKRSGQHGKSHHADGTDGHNNGCDNGTEQGLHGKGQSDDIIQQGNPKTDFQYVQGTPGKTQEGRQCMELLAVQDGIAGPPLPQGSSLVALYEQ